MSVMFTLENGGRLFGVCLFLFIFGAVLLCVLGFAFWTEDLNVDWDLDTDDVSLDIDDNIED